MHNLSNSGFTRPAAPEPEITKFVAAPPRTLMTEKGEMTKFSTGAGTEMSVPTYGDAFEQEVLKFAREGHAYPFNAAVLSNPEAYNAHVKAVSSGRVIDAVPLAMLSLLRRPAVVANQTPPTRRAIFTRADLPRFAVYVQARARWAELSSQGRKFCEILAGSQGRIQHAMSVFVGDLSDAGFVEMLDVVAAESRYQTLLARDPGMPTALRTVYPKTVFSGEFPALNDDLALILDWMGERYAEELDATRPIEEARIEAEDERLRDYGASGQGLDTIDVRSPVLRRLNDNLTQIRADAAKLRAGKTLNEPLYTAGGYIDPVLQILSMISPDSAPGDSPTDHRIQTGAAAA